LDAANGGGTAGDAAGAAGGGEKVPQPCVIEAVKTKINNVLRDIIEALYP
jgi:hypothetical protein